MANTLTREGIGWIREQTQGRLMAPWRIAAILAITEEQVAAVINGVTEAEAAAMTAPPRKAGRRPS